MVIKLNKDRVNFTQFILTHDEAIFGKKKNAIGKPNTMAYAKQIAALDMKMNELMDKDPEKAADTTFLLGLFALAISQFGVTVKTDVNRYKDEFIQFIESNRKG